MWPFGQQVKLTPNCDIFGKFEIRVKNMDCYEEKMKMSTVFG